MSAQQPSGGQWMTIYMPGGPPKPNDPEMDALNAKLNASETMLRGRIGDEKVDDLIDRFRAAGMADPTLFKALYAKRDPYRWLAQHWAPKQPPTSH